jgi:hypothetical protein
MPGRDLAIFCRMAIRVKSELELLNQDKPVKFEHPVTYIAMEKLMKKRFLAVSQQ